MTPDQIHENVVRQYREHINPYLAKLMHFAGFGVETDAQGCIIRDHDGREFLDFLGGYGVFSLGHRHPEVVAALKDQLDHLPLSGKTFFSGKQAALAEKLAQIAPSPLQYTFFSNSGTEAVEAALKFAKATTKRSKIVSTIGGYHGKTIGALSTTGREKYRQPFEPLMPGVEFVPYGDLDAAKAIIDNQTAAVIIETVQGEGGIHIPPPGYLKGLQEAAHSHGALLIVDEVQTGIGRTGKMFGSEHEEIHPDIMTLAKALGGGAMPIGATMFSQQIADAVYSQNPLAHTSTFGGNPLACTAGLKTLEIIERDNLAQRAHDLGQRFMTKLSDNVKHLDLVADIRGQGLMIGVEFSMDEVGELVTAQVVKRGVVVAYTLNNPRVIRLEPPLIVTEQQIDQAVEALTGAILETQELLAAFA